jgi:hypothetical protein
MAEFVEADSWPDVDRGGGPGEIPDVTKLGGVLRRLNRLQAERDEIDEVYAAEVARLDAWRQDRQDGIDKQIAYGREAVEDFMRVRYEATDQTRLELADGTPKLTKPRERTVVTDEEAFLAWVKGEPSTLIASFDELVARLASGFAHPELVRVTVTVKPDRDAIKALDTLPNVTVDRSGPVPMMVKSLVAPDSAEVSEEGEIIAGTGKPIPGVHIEREQDLVFSLKLEEHV